MQTKTTIEEIIKNIKFTMFDTLFKYNVQEKGDGFLIQIRGYIYCNEERFKSWQHGGKYYISKHAIKDEIVAVCWKAAQDFVIHEARETFFYKNQTIYQSHYSVDELASFCSTASKAKRSEHIYKHIKELEHKQDIDF